MMGIDAIIIVSVLILIFYLVISKFLKKRIRNSNLRIFICSIMSIFFGFIFYMIFFSAFIYFLTREKTRSFDKEDWIVINDDIEKRMNRYEMLDDLVDSKIFINKDTIEVKKILGEPNYRNHKAKVWTYEAGTGGGFGFVDHYLDIDFRNNKVIKLQHRRIQD